MRAKPPTHTPLHLAHTTQPPHTPTPCHGGTIKPPSGGPAPPPVTTIPCNSPNTSPSMAFASGPVGGDGTLSGDEEMHLRVLNAHFEVRMLPVAVPRVWFDTLVLSCWPIRECCGCNHTQKQSVPVAAENVHFFPSSPLRIHHFAHQRRDVWYVLIQTEVNERRKLVAEAKAEWRCRVDDWVGPQPGGPLRVTCAIILAPPPAFLAAVGGGLCGPLSSCVRCCGSCEV